MEMSSHVLEVKSITENWETVSSLEEPKERQEK